MDPTELLEISLKEIQDPKKLWQRFGKEAFEITQIHDFKSYNTAKSKKALGVVHSKDFIKGMKMGFTIGVIQAVRSEKYFDTCLQSMKAALKGD